MTSCSVFGAKLSTAPSIQLPGVDKTANARSRIPIWNDLPYSFISKVLLPSVSTVLSVSLVALTYGPCGAYGAAMAIAVGTTRPETTAGLRAMEMLTIVIA
jgi:hypothetical protein